MIRKVQPSESVSEAVVKAVGATKDCPPPSLPPLYNAVDPEALNKVFSVTNSDASDRGGQISFHFSSCFVTVSENRYIKVQNSKESIEAGTHHNGSSTVLRDTPRIRR